MRARRATMVTALTTASLIVGASLLAGCGGGGDSAGTTSSAGSRAQADAPAIAGEKAAPGTDGALGASGGGASGRNTSARVVPIDRAVIRRGDITVRVKDVAAAAARAETFANGVDGLVFAEETSTEPGRKAASRATMTLKVPPTQFDPVLDQLGGLGKQLSKATNTEDVTSKAVDIESRLRSQRASVARLQALMAKATTVGAIVQVEGELSRREADLEALEAQQKSLDDLVDLATINVTLVAPDVKVAPPAEKDSLGFMPGLRGGLNALLVIVVVTLTAAGALLPFAIALALVGVPAWLVLRGRRHPAPAVAPAAASDG